jgi:hypothetical protein
LDQALLFIAAVGGLVSIVPLSIWLATGRLSSAWYALKEYALVLFILIGAPMMLGAVIVLIEYVTP